jgi:hypothetical protein
MYRWIWKSLPGPAPVRLGLSLILFASVVAALFLWVFPWVQPRLPFGDVTVTSLSTGSSTDGDGVSPM